MRRLEQTSTITLQGLQVRSATVEEQSQWDALVDQFPHRLYHKRAWIQSIEDFARAKAIYLVFEKDRAVLGCFPGFLMHYGPLRIFGSPREGWQTETMGPVFDRNRATAHEIVSAAVQYLEHCYHVRHIEFASDQLDADVMETLGFRGQKLLTYQAPLFPADEEQALSNLDRKTRNQLRKAVKLGLQVHTETSEEFLDEVLDQTTEVFIRRGKTVPYGKERLLALFRRLSASGHLLALSVRKPDEGDVCLATGLFTIEGRELTLWSWTHRSAYGSCCPIEILTWTAMQKAMASGCTLFQMTGGGAGKPKFGATLTDMNWRWIRSQSRLISETREIVSAAYRWQQKVRGRWYRGSSQDSRTHSGPALPQPKVEYQP